MQFFSPFEYLCIDIANHFGLDKELFETRIQWVKDNKDQLEALAPQADTKPLYQKAVMTLRAAQRGEAVGHPVAWDGVCSGMQIMSALTGCIEGAKATGLVDYNRRADAYSTVTACMNIQPGITVTIPRADAKDATMTSLYASKARPKAIFGEGTPELDAFYKAMETVAPGAWKLLSELLAAWNPMAKVHTWQLPDGYDAHVRVMQTKEARIEVDELDHATFTYVFEVNEGSKTGLSLVANVTHSFDAYVLRSMQRRCNYNVEQVLEAQLMVENERLKRMQGINFPIQPLTEIQQYYLKLFDATGMPDVVILDCITDAMVASMSWEHLEGLSRTFVSMLRFKPTQVLTVHDAFASLPSGCNAVRWHYKEILADLAESEALNYVLCKLYQCNGTYDKLSNNLGAIIRKSNYGLS